MHPYIPMQQWPEVSYSVLPAPFLHAIRLGSAPYGIRWGVWPLFLEEYVSDDEPDMKMSAAVRPAPARFVIWRRINRTDSPKGWLQVTWKSPMRNGYCHVAQSGDYRLNWNKTARYESNLWRSKYLGQEYEIVNVTWDEFDEGYRLSSANRKIQRLLITGFERLYKHFPNAISLWGVRHVPSGRIVAGMGNINSIVARSSYYYVGYFVPGHSGVPVMVGLFDHWFKFCQENGYLVAQPGRFWQKGDPDNWKGFSTFKSKFGTKYVQYQPTLIRFMGWSK